MNKVIFMKPFLICALPFIFSCFYIKKKREKISGIQVTQLFPDVVNDSLELKGYDTLRSRVYYYNNQVLYKTAVSWDSTVNGEVMATGIKYYYFTYTTGEQYGIYNDESINMLGKKVPVDSMLRQDPAGNREMYEIYTRCNGKLVSRYIDRGKGMETRICTLKGGRPGEQDPTVFDSMYLTFTDRLKDSKYSLSKKFDSISNSKLSDVVIVDNPVYLRKNNIHLAKVTLHFWLDEIKVDNEAELMKYFDEDRDNNMSGRSQAEKK